MTWRRRPGTLLLLACVLMAAGAQAPAPPPAPPNAPFLRIDAGAHTQVVNRIAQDRDGRIIATASDDKTVRVWQASDGALLATLRVPIADGDEGAVYAVAISPDGKTLLAGGYTGYTWDHAFALYIFDLETGHLRGRLPGLPAPINHLAFAPDGQSFAIAMGAKAGMRLVSATNGALLAEDAGYRDRTAWVAFDALGRFVTASFDGEVRLYAAAGHLLAHRAPVPGGHPYSAAFSPDGRSIAVGYADQPRVELLNATDLTGRASMAQPGHDGLGAVAWARDGGLYAAGSLHGPDGNTVLRHWAPGTTTRPVDRPGLHDTVFELAATDDGGVLLAGADPALVRMTADGQVVFRNASPGLDFRDLADHRFTASYDGSAVELQAKAMRVAWSVDLKQRTVRTIPALPSPPAAMAPKGALAVAGWRNLPSPMVDGRPVALDPEELSRTYAANDRVAVIGTDYKLRTYRSGGVPVDAKPLPSPVWAVALSGDGKVVVAALGDGTLRWFGLDPDGQLSPRVAMFLAADGVRWVAWTPEGFFDHSDLGGKELVGVQLNRARNQLPDWYSFAQIYRLLYAPDTVAARLRGEGLGQAEPSVDGLRAMLAAAPPPVIALSEVCWSGAKGKECHPVAPSSTSRDLRQPQASAVDATVPPDVQEVTLRYSLAGTAAEESTVDIFVNGRNSGRALRTVDQAGDALEQSAPVEPGVNRLQLHAYDRNQVAYTQSRTVDVSRAPPAAADASKPKMFILAVGVDRYPATVNSLAFAVADARSVAHMITAHAPLAYGGVRLTELYDEDASTTKVLAALNRIAAEAGTEDTVLIYLSGHGVTLDRHYYFITQNLISFEKIPQTAISEAMLVKALSGIKAQNSLLFLDTCHAGAFSLDSASQIAHETGRYVLAASASVEEALDSYDNRNGVFATAVLRGLAGGALRNQGGLVDNFSLGLFVTPLVHELATERHHNQSARFKIAAEDAHPFAIAEIKGNAKPNP